VLRLALTVLVLLDLSQAPQVILPPSVTCVLSVLDLWDMTNVIHCNSVMPGRAELPTMKEGC